MKINRLVLVRLNRLLDMMYRPSELAAELECPVRSIYRHVAAGCPHTRDDDGHIWINGQEFQRWAQARQGKRQPLKDGEAYCLRDNRPVQMMEPITVRPVKRHLELVSGTCPICGGIVNRARARERKSIPASQGER